MWVFMCVCFFLLGYRVDVEDKGSFTPRVSILQLHWARKVI